ncbi:MAG: cell division protein PerM, partial [Nocardioidaceae bacterium]
AGVAGGVFAVHSAPAFGVDRAALSGALAGVVGGLGLGLALLLSGGAVGPGRMATMGPDTWACLGVAVAAMGFGGALGGAGRHLLRHLRG